MSITTPANAQSHHRLGFAYHEQGKLDDAIACYQKALSLDPEFALAHFDLARALESLGRSAEALAGYQEAVLLKPDFAEAHFGLGKQIQAQGLIEDALESFRTALLLKPDFVEARWTAAISQLAVVHAEGDDPENYRAEFSKALTDLDRWFDAGRARDGFRGVGMMQPFYLAYHLQNNRDLLSQYGDLCARLMRRWQDDQGLALRPPKPHPTIRVGIVSAHIYNQPVWNAIVKGWCKHLDRTRISTHLFYLGHWRDDETAFAQSQSTSFVQGPKRLGEWVDTLLAGELDVIIYPEIGMDHLAVRLASMRLAPVQIVAWGHPETTGLPTIDYYLSAQDFEPADAQANYRERLVKLPNLGCCYPALNVRAMDIDLGELGVASDVPILLCPGTPFKYSPQHDWIWAEIAQRLGACQLVFFNHHLENLSEKLQQRLDAVFEQSDLYLGDYAVFIPWLNRPAFYGLLQAADVYLDTIGFSGFNTAMQAIECGLPVVTCEGSFMRGRFASAILKRMGIPELVAPSEQGYVELVVKLAQNADYRHKMRERIATSRHVLFDDLAPIRALEDFLIEAVQTRS